MSDAVAQGRETQRAEQIAGIDTGWQVICRPQAPDRARLRCSMFYELGAAADRGRLVSIEIVREAKAGTLIIGVPLGVSLKDGVEINAGAGRLKLSFTNCLGASCFARLELNQKTVDMLKAARAVSIEFFDGKGARIRPDINMAGFSEALSKSE